MGKRTATKPTANPEPVQWQPFIHREYGECMTILRSHVDMEVPSSGTHLGYVENLVARKSVTEDMQSQIERLARRLPELLDLYKSNSATCQERINHVLGLPVPTNLISVASEPSCGKTNLHTFPNADSGKAELTEIVEAIKQCDEQKKRLKTRLNELLG
jgi:hypothetical protein